MKSSQSLTVIFLAAVTLTAAPGCRFRSPSLSEEQELASRGALTGNSTDWVAAPLARGQMLDSGGYNNFSGGIPDYRHGPAPLDKLSSGIVSEPAREVQAVKTAETPKVEEKSPSEESPLDRVERSCPGTETQVTDALKTTDRAARIKKYEALTRSCTTSSELWMWLGVDYERSEQIDEAKHAYEEAVLLSPRNDEAKGHLAAIQRKIAESMRTK